jgi:DNA-binding MarR family transcriptional regulator
MDHPCFANSLVYRFHKLMFLMDRHADQLLRKEFDLGLAQFFILMAIFEHTECSQRDIAKYLELTEPAVSRHVEGLTTRGYIVRRTNANNRREHLLQLSEDGTHSYHQITGALIALADEHLLGLSGMELSQLDGTISKLLAHYEQTVGPACPNPEQP